VGDASTLGLVPLWDSTILPWSSRSTFVPLRFSGLQWRPQILNLILLHYSLATLALVKSTEYQ
jgi:hypothetical protein